MSSGTNGIYSAWCFNTKSKSNLNPERDRDLPGTVPGFGPVISRSLSNPIIHLNIPDLVPALAEALIAARSGGYFPCAAREHWRRIDSSVLAISQNTLVDMTGPQDSDWAVEFSGYRAGEWDRFQLKPCPAIAGSRFAA
jgi:hypothetical protein